MMINYLKNSFILFIDIDDMCLIRGNFANLSKTVQFWGTFWNHSLGFIKVSIWLYVLVALYSLQSRDKGLKQKSVYWCSLRVYKVAARARRGLQHIRLTGHLLIRQPRGRRMIALYSLCVGLLCTPIRAFDLGSSA